MAEIRYIYRGGQPNIPRDTTHVFVHAKKICAWVFHFHPNIVEVICHDGVEQIEMGAFANCPSLRRVIMPGVKEVEEMAFNFCPALADVECGKLEIIKEQAFHRNSLKTINLPSARILEPWAFGECEALTDVKFGSKLERFDDGVFIKCKSLERINIPLKDNLFTDDTTFSGCRNLKRVDVVEGEMLHQTVGTLLREEWKQDMNEEIDSINQILPNVRAGEGFDADAMDYGNPGEKALAIQRWIRSVLGKIVHYKAQHSRVLSEAVTAIQQQFALPNDILTNNVLPFLTLPSHTFEGESNRRGR